MKELLPTNDEVPRELFFPADWQGKRAWSNANIITTLLPDGVDNDKPLPALKKYPPFIRFRVEKSYKNPRSTTALKWKKEAALEYDHSEYEYLTTSHGEDEDVFLQHNLILKHMMPCVAIDANYYSMIVAMYGIDVELYFGGNGETAVSVYKDDELVALIMPIKDERLPAKN